MRPLRELYEEIKAKHAEEIGLDRIPQEFRSHLVCVGGASEQAHPIGRLPEERDARRVLVVGVFGGRDFWYLKGHGFDVNGFDLVQPPGFPPIYVGNVEDASSLPKGPYDAIVLIELLEQVRDDTAVLMNLRDLIGPRGTLILTGPFLDDRPEYHLRIYSPATIRRLLGACGFEVTALHYRPGPVPSILRPAFNYLLHTFNDICYLLTRRTIYHRLLPHLWAIYDYMSRWERPNRLGRAFGATIAAVSIEDATDHVELNRLTFWGHHSE